MITLKTSGKFTKTSKYFNKLLGVFDKTIFDKYGQMGVEALRASTPKATGKTSESWSYSVEINDKQQNAKIVWKNSNIVDGYPIAILLQYGHATRNGAYVEGVDYINPALKPIFEEIKKNIWEEVKNS